MTRVEFLMGGGSVERATNGQISSYFVLLMRRQKVSRKREQQQGGVSCHQCKSRRNCFDLTYCTSNLEKKKKKCRKKYCDHCLSKFYGEKPPKESESEAWRCPSCRKTCCCAACRRRREVTRPQDVESRTAPSHRTVPVPAQARHSTQSVSPASSMATEPTPIKTSANPFARAAMDSSSSDSTESSRRSVFETLYAIAQLPSVKKHIKYILRRNDVTDEQKKETIASLLRGGRSPEIKPLRTPSIFG
eukprot:CAMPEP_0167823616 /NCGR_PEP_ID=MMETSP0112_2-20121227/8236_1 /TAXON_ID=91324 /ORGANISM="Lotharella globosa, Strain CCCM811" /LENGTH=246 /DNA_ID=CAMNT_0007725285 /DNA_START=9 /DNA_END=750 /DNA_ORIENTATION=-